MITSSSSQVSQDGFFKRNYVSIHAPNVADATAQGTIDGIPRYVQRLQDAGEGHTHRQLWCSRFRLRATSVSATRSIHLTVHNAHGPQHPNVKGLCDKSSARSDNIERLRRHDFSHRPTVLRFTSRGRKPRLLKCHGSD
jgi:hypothetical protein